MIKMMTCIPISHQSRSDDEESFDESANSKGSGRGKEDYNMDDHFDTDDEDDRSFLLHAQAEECTTFPDGVVTATVASVSTIATKSVLRATMTKIKSILPKLSSHSNDDENRFVHKS